MKGLFPKLFVKNEKDIVKQSMYRFNKISFDIQLDGFGRYIYIYRALKKRFYFSPKQDIKTLQKFNSLEQTYATLVSRFLFYPLFSHRSLKGLQGSMIEWMRHVFDFVYDFNFIHSSLTQPLL